MVPIQSGSLLATRSPFGSASMAGQNMRDQAFMRLKSASSTCTPSSCAFEEVEARQTTEAMDPIPSALWYQAAATAVGC